MSVAKIIIMLKKTVQSLSFSKKRKCERLVGFQDDNNADDDDNDDYDEIKLSKFKQNSS